MCHFAKALQPNLHGETGWNCDASFAPLTSTCIWGGVICVGGTVTAISLGSTGISGTLPTAIGYITALRQLDMCCNNIQGTLPSEIGYLTSLIYIQLESNSLIGTIPTTIGLITALTLLSLDSNHFTGTVPTSFGLLTNLRYLQFHSNTGINSFTGSLPTQLCLDGLTHLTISTTLLTCYPPCLYSVAAFSAGTVPVCGQCKFRILSFILCFTIELFLSDTAMCDLAAAMSVPGWACSGGVPTTTLCSAWSGIVCANSVVRQILQSTASLSGSLPATIGYLSAMTYLDFSNNQVHGTLPTSMGELTMLTKFKGNINHFVGPIPTELGYLSALTSLSFSYNSFSKSIPAEMSHMTALQLFGADDNFFTGSIPSTFCSLHLSALSLENNFITCYPACLSTVVGKNYGTIPKCTPSKYFKKIYPYCSMLTSIIY